MEGKEQKFSELQEDIRNETANHLNIQAMKEQNYVPDNMAIVEKIGAEIKIW